MPSPNRKSFSIVAVALAVTMIATPVPAFAEGESGQASPARPNLAEAAGVLDVLDLAGILLAEYGSIASPALTRDEATELVNMYASTPDSYESVVIAADGVISQALPVPRLAELDAAWADSDATTVDIFSGLPIVVDHLGVAAAAEIDPDAIKAIPVLGGASPGLVVDPVIPGIGDDTEKCYTNTPYVAYRTLLNSTAVKYGHIDYYCANTTSITDANGQTFNVFYSPSNNWLKWQGQVTDVSLPKQFPSENWIHSSTGHFCWGVQTFVLGHYCLIDYFPGIDAEATPPNVYTAPTRG